MPELAVRFDEVVAGYGAGSVLHGLTFDVPADATTALVGPNGAGKTTTLRVLAGTLGITGGELQLNGRPCPRRALRRIRPGVALAPEGRRLFGEMTVCDNLLVGAFVARRDAAGIERTLREVYARLPLLEERQHARAGTLSGGQQSLVAIGRALMRSPQLLLLDEPTLGLSPKVCQEVVEHIRGIREAGTTVILVEQNAAVALELADHVHVIESGVLVASGTASELRGSDRLTAGYFGTSLSAA